MSGAAMAACGRLGLVHGMKGVTDGGEGRMGEQRRRGEDDARRPDSRFVGLAEAVVVDAETTGFDPQVLFLVP